VPVSFGTAVLSSQLVDALHYPVDFENMVPLVSLLALHIPIVAVTIVVASCLNAIDRQWSWVKVGVAAAVLNPALNFPLVPVTQRLYDNGAIGAAVVTLLTEIFMLAGGLALLPKNILGRPALEASARTVLAGLLMVIAILPFRQTPLVALVLAGAIIYVASAFVLKATTVAECKSLMRLLSSRASRNVNRPNLRPDGPQEAMSIPPA